MKKAIKINQEQKILLTNKIKEKGSTQSEIKRAQAILLIDKESIADINTLTGYSKKYAYRLRRNFLNKGIEALKDKRNPKAKTILSKKQREEIIETITSKSPNECDTYYNSNYWTTGILGEYIKRKYKAVYQSKTSFYLIFKQAKFSFHKPGKVYEKRDEEKVRFWKKEILKEVEKAYFDKQTTILCEDEMVLSSQTTFQKIWLRQGEYPKIEVSNTKTNKSIYGFLNIKTSQAHAFKAERQNMFITTEILSEIRKLYPSQKILLFWDGAGWHRGSKVTEYINNDKNIRIIYFPPYSPEENPQEHVWKKGRSHVTHNVFIKDINELTDKFVAYINNTHFKYSLLHLGTLT